MKPAKTSYSFEFEFEFEFGRAVVNRFFPGEDATELAQALARFSPVLVRNWASTGRSEFEADTLWVTVRLAASPRSRHCPFNHGSTQKSLQTEMTCKESPHLLTRSGATLMHARLIPFTPGRLSELLRRRSRRLARP